jgi:hypothetical protein
MKQQKLLIVDNTRDVNDYLDKGWEIISVTAQFVSAGTSYSQKGEWAIVIQKQN